MNPETHILQSKVTWQGCVMSALVRAFIEPTCMAIHICIWHLSESWSSRIYHMHVSSSVGIHKMSAPKSIASHALGFSAFSCVHPAISACE